jgi:hypothetical protein
MHTVKRGSQTLVFQIPCYFFTVLENPLSTSFLENGVCFVTFSIKYISKYLAKYMHFKTMNYIIYNYLPIIYIFMYRNINIVGVFCTSK